MRVLTLSLLLFVLGPAFMPWMWQGCARMMAPIGTPVPGPTVGWKQANGRLADPVRLGRNFRICWLKVCVLLVGRSESFYHSWSLWRTEWGGGHASRVLSCCRDRSSQYPRPWCSACQLTCRSPLPSCLSSQMCELSFFKTKHLRNPYNENYPVKVRLMMM